MGTNLTNMDYEKYLGGYFGKFRNLIAKKYIDDSDCIIAIGAVCTDINTFDMSLPKKINKEIAIYGTYTFIDGKRYDNVKMSDLLTNITKLIEPKNIKADKPNIGYKHKYPENEPLTTEYVYSRLQEFFKSNDILIAETGSVPYGAGQIKFPEGTDVQFQLLWGSIGWATPAAMGACLAKPESRIVLITGEGAHQITALEIGNMLRLGLKPIIIVINNPMVPVFKILLIPLLIYYIKINYSYLSLILH